MTEPDEYRPHLGDFFTREHAGMKRAARYVAIIDMRDRRIARARADSRLLTKWASVQVHALRDEGLTHDQIVGQIQAEGGNISSATVRRIIAKRRPRLAR